MASVRLLSVLLKEMKMLFLPISRYSDIFLKSRSIYDAVFNKYLETRGGLMVSAHALVPGSSGPGSSPGRGHCVVFLGKTLYSHSASLHPGV